MYKIIFLFFFFFFFIQTEFSKNKYEKNLSNSENNEKAEKECRLVEEYIPIEKDNIQSIAGTGLEVGGVKLRPEGCAWNSERGWYKPDK